MDLDFVNRDAELAELDSAGRRGGLLVVYGRRRVGKTCLLRRWLDSRRGHYSQAIEAHPSQQLEQLFTDLRPGLDIPIQPRTWDEFLEVLSRQSRPWTLCLDEFPYLAAADSSLPSRLQKWIDHSMPRKCLLILSGSSTRMMHDLFLNRAAPLFGRAQKLLAIPPMDYAAFCKACGLKAGDLESFERFACVGGIPRYWEFVERGQSVLQLAEALYFDPAPFMEQEPQRILRDEGATGLTATAVLEAVGRGAERPSEIAGRLCTPQTSLSRPIQQLIDASVLTRDLPFGESLRSTKKVLYRIQDPSIRFWFRVYSPHRTLWPTLPLAERRKLIHDHAALVFEDHCRAQIPGASRWWDKNMELDLVAPDPEKRGGLLVAEVKFRRLSAAESRAGLVRLESAWSRCPLRARFPMVRFQILDAARLGA